MFDPEKFGAAMADAIKAAVAPLREEIATLRAEVAKKLDADALPAPADPLPLPDFVPMIAAQLAEAVKSLKLPEPEAPLGVAGALIDRDGNLMFTLSNGDVKNLGKVVGTDGKDGIGMDGLDLEYDADHHEIQIRAVSGERTKTVRFAAGGIRPGGYWRSGVQAKACEAWTRDGNMYVANRDTTAQPDPASADWTLFARKGRDGESTVRQAKPEAQPINLGAAA